MPYLGIAEVILFHFNFVNNNYKHNSILGISPEHFILSKTFNSEFSYIEVWFTHQNSTLLETQDKVNITLVIN